MRDQKINYFVLPDQKAVACIGKSGSTAIGKAILARYYPDKIPVTAGADPRNAPGWQAFVPKTETPDSPIIPVRDPVERFRSACAQTRKQDKVDEVLDQLEAGKGLANNFHFVPATAYLTGTSTLYRFPEHIEALAEALSLGEIPVVNDGGNNPPKPELTAEQLARVEALYAEDIALFNSITEPGTIYNKPSSEPEPSPVPPSITARQFFKVLAEDGNGEDQILAIATQAGFTVTQMLDLKAELRASHFFRANPMINLLAPYLGYDTDEKVDGVFRRGESL